MKTVSEINELKRQWLQDGIWDIEDTEGFEDYREELLAYRLEQERLYQEREQERLQNKADSLQCSIALVKYIESLEYKIKGIQETIDNE